jgi:hypothetical protein
MTTDASAVQLYASPTAFPGDGVYAWRVRLEPAVEAAGSNAPAGVAAAEQLKEAAP